MSSSQSEYDFRNKRYAHYEAAAKFLLIEYNMSRGAGRFSDLKKKFLDKLVQDNKEMSDADQQGLLKRVKDKLNTMCRVFDERDSMLSKQAYAPMYYLFVDEITTDYAHSALNSKIHQFLESFAVERTKNLAKPEDERDGYLTEFGRLIMQGTNDKTSLEERVRILRRFFLLQHSDVNVRDTKRAYSEEERFVIWVRSGKQCTECSKELSDLSDMHADHIIQHSYGGPTVLANARALCAECNLKIAKRVG